MPESYWLGVSFLAGIAVGSFLNVVAHRLPLKLSLVSPGSRCPSCETPLGPTENIPVLGWLLLQGRCKHCGVKISPRYPLVEATTGVLFALITAQFGFLTSGGLAAWGLVSILIALSLIDWDTLELPHELTLPAIYGGLAWQVWGQFPLQPLLGLMAGLLGYGVAVLLLDGIAVLGRTYLWLRSAPRVGPFLPIEVGFALLILGIGWGLGTWQGAPIMGTFIVYGGALLLWDTVQIVRTWVTTDTEANSELDPEEELMALGGGDVMLGGLLGVWLGWQGLLVAIAIGFILGACYGIGLRLSGRLQALERFAFGPFLAMGGVVSLFMSSWVIDSYLRFLGIA